MCILIQNFSNLNVKAIKEGISFKNYEYNVFITNQKKRCRIVFTVFCHLCMCF